jgi:glutathione S-transferase
MYKLYDGTGTGGVTARAALAELELNYEIIDIDLGTGQECTEEFTRINPCQQVPVLELPDGTILAENLAILMHLADSHPEGGLAPACGSVERAQVNRWLSFFAMNVYGPEYLRMRPAFYTTNPSEAEGIAEAATAFLIRHYSIFESMMSDGPYYLGDQFSILDLYIWMLGQYWGDYDMMRSDWPKTYRLIETVMMRPAVKPVHDAHFGPGMGF